MALYRDIFVDQNSDYSSTIIIADTNGDPINVAAYTFEGSFSRSYDSETSYDLTLAIVDGANGNISVSLLANVSANLEPGKYMYDLNMSLNTATTRFREGILTINPGVIR